MSARGIYVVAFGEPARACALSLMRTCKEWMADIPICLCATSAIGPEDLLVTGEDSDIGARTAKLKVYERTPAEWDAVLYLDADMLVVGDITRYFEWIEDGWEFVICKDVRETLDWYRRPNNAEEIIELEGLVKTLHLLQWNGGAFSFGRGEPVRKFFERWFMEWDRYAQRDQGALIRAMYSREGPLRMHVLGNEWNTFPKYNKSMQTAGLLHFPGNARRWSGLIAGRIDGPAAWKAVKAFERRARSSRASRRVRVPVSGA